VTRKYFNPKSATSEDKIEQLTAFYVEILKR